MSTTDADLLRSYANDGSNAAFATLVERHLNLVYSVARRHVRSSALAEDVAQAVFIELAHHARRIKPGTPLVAWLHLVSRRTALNAARGEIRRQIRETAAAAELTPGGEQARPELAEWVESTMKTNSSAWTEIAPLLDEAVESLNPTDRSAILLRFFENKSLREVGEALGASEDAAQKRVTRALDQLRALLLRRGLTVTAAGLATNLSAHAIESASAGLGATIAASATLSTTAQGGATVIARHLAMTTTKKILATATLSLALGVAFYETTVLWHLRNQLGRVELESSRQLEAARQLQHERDEARRGLALAGQDRGGDAKPAAGSDAALEAEILAWQARVDRLKQALDQRPEQKIPELQLLLDRDWFSVAQQINFNRPEQLQRSFEYLRSKARQRLSERIRSALAGYRADAAHEKSEAWPADFSELQHYFVPPLDPAILARYDFHGSSAGGELVEKAADGVDEERLLTVEWNSGLNDHFETATERMVHEAQKAFAAANHGQRATDAFQLQTYLRHPVDPAKLKAAFRP